MRIEPFSIDTPERALEDLRHRLQNIRLPEPLASVGWNEGMDAHVLRDLLAHWSTTFDWRAQEAALNRLPQFVASLGEQEIHFVHQRGIGPIRCRWCSPTAGPARSSRCSASSSC
jgi:hypothetical protein